MNGAPTPAPPRPLALPPGQWVVTTSADDTRQRAAALAATLPAEVTLALHGDLGAGKTTFVQGLAAAWGLPGPVTSPTFTLLRLHRHPAAARTLLHLDAYRLPPTTRPEDLALDDFLTPPWCLALEWPDRAPLFATPPVLHLDFELLPTGHHRLRLRP